MKIFNSAVTALTAFVTVLLSSCTADKVDRASKESVLTLVKMDWSCLGLQPQGCTVIFYPEDGGDCIRAKTNSVERTFLRVPPGEYTVLVFSNSEKEYGTMTFFGSDNLDSYRVVLESRSRGWVSKEDVSSRVVCEPERFAVGRADCFTVRSLEQRSEDTSYNSGECSLDEWAADSVSIEPSLGYGVLQIEVPVKGVNNLSSVRAYVTGLSGGRLLYRAEPLDTAATFFVSSWSLDTNPENYAEGTITASLRCFGPLSDERSMMDSTFCRLHLEMMLSDDSTMVCRDFPLSDYLFTNLTEMSVEVTLDEDVLLPDVKPKGGSGSLFDIDFGDWDENLHYGIPV